MSGETGMRLRVNPEELVIIADEVEGQIGEMRKLMNAVDELVNRSSAYWEGEGQSAYLRAYHSKQDAAEQALQYFSENVVNLRTIAGIYQATEATATEAANSLAADVIV